MNSELSTQNFGISGYHLTEKLYESNSSLVYRGYREANEQPVVLKILQETNPTPERFAWFKREYQVTRNLNLAGVVKAYAFFSEQHRQVMVLEDFGGDSLARLEVAGKLELDEFLELAIAITQILDQIHTAQIIHKDINPSNIVLNPTTKVVKIIDFGISTVLARENPTFCHPNFLEGTLPYISPEQTGRMNRAIDYRSDFYSLGITFYELLTGRLPFVSDDPLELVHCHLAKQPPPLRESTKGEITEIIGEIVLKLMEKNPEDCYQSAYGIQADLESCLHQLQTKGQIDFFPLGRNDISDKFHIPQKLYGREREIATLLAAFERVAGDRGDGEIGRWGTGEMGRWGAGGDGELGELGERGRLSSDSQFPIPKQLTTNNNTEMILVSGYSGVGKSALVNEISKPITAQRGNFIAGKFDQYQRNVPYSAISQAFNQLCNQLLSESTATFKEWQQKILAAVGNNGQVLIDVIPNLELVIGQQPAVAPVGLQEAQNRFNLVCRNFIQAVCQQEHPLVLFIDDLQWVDGASLSLLRTIMSSREIHHLLIIGAYRDNEVDLNHLLMITLEEIKQESGRLSTIHLENLANYQVNALVAEALACPATACQQLSSLVYAKTQGNPFFTIEFLRSLYTEGLLSFNQTKRNWQWDLTKIQAKNITDNVVELMVEKIRHLPEATQTILKLAACLGNTFDLSTLAIISQPQPAEVLTDLFPALQEGLVVPLNEQYKLIEDLEAAEVKFKFLHDRVQQAAYYLIDEHQRQVIHLQIGRLLYGNTKTEELEEHIFEIVNHFNQSIVLIREDSEKIIVTELNLLAGKTAKAATAYSSAVNYLTIGLALLTKDSWLHQYELTLNLYVEAVEAEYLNTNYERAEILTDIVLQNASTILEKVKVYTLRILSYSAQNQMQQAIDTGLQVLELLGVSLVKSPPPKLVIEDLYNLPEMTEPDKQAAMQILMMLFAPVYITNPSLLPSISLTMVDLCLKYGNCRLAAYAYGLYGLLLCGVLGDIEAGYKFGKLALKVLAKFEAREIHCRIYNKFYSFIIHWKEDAHRSLLPLTQDTIQVGLETGEIEFACYATVSYCINLVLLGEPLESVQQQHLQYLGLISNLKQEFQLYYTQIWAQFVVNLLNQSTDKQQLIGEIFDERETLPILQANNNLSSLYCLYLTKAMLCYLFKEYRTAATNAALAAQYESSVVGLFPAAQNPFYYSLALLALYPTATSNEQQEYLKKVAANQQQLKIWANHAPMNFQHKYELVAAERARVLGQNWEASEFYEGAIQGARDNKYLQEEALAYELAAEFYLTHNRLEIAATYLTKAHYCYKCWQAWAKVKDLEAKYPQFLVPNSSKITTTTSTKDTKTSAALDLTSILKASHTLSGEIVLDNLLTKMMKIIIENAGAEIGYLLMEKRGQWLIEASAKVNSEQVKRRQKAEGKGQKIFTGNERNCIVELWQSIPMETVSGSSDSPMVSNAIVNYVIRTQESVVLNNAAKEGNFIRDLYILKQQPKSVLCTPLLHQGKLLGILYLENNLTTEVFTPERLKVLNFLSSQAAISIENAKLYAEVQTNESRLNQFLEAMPVGVGVLDKHGRPYYVNHKAQELLGKGIVQEANPDTIAESYQNYIAGTNQLYPSEDLPIVRALQGESTTVDDLEIHQGDKIIPVEAWGTPIYDQQGNITYGLVAFQDITERRQAQKLLADYNSTLEEQVAQRTEALIESEERYRRIVETSNEGIWLIDGESRTTFVNPQMAQMLGYSVEEMLGMPMFAFMDEEGRKIASNNVQRRRQGISEQHDFKFRRKDGSDLWTIICATTILDEEGQYFGALGMVTDISSRKALERELALREARLNAFFEAAPIGMLIVDPQLRYVQINKLLAQINGQPINEHIGKSLGEVIPDIAPKIEPIYRQVLTTRKPILNQEIRGEVPSQPGIERYWLVSYFPILDSDRGCSGVGGVVVEISAQKQAEQALRESQVQYQSLVNVLPQCLYRTDTQGKITFGNRAFLSTLAMSLEECLGKTVYDLYPQELADKYTADNKIVMETGVTLDIVETHKAPIDDSPIYVQVIKSPVRDENGHIIGTQGIFWDVTERQQTEENLQKALEAAEIANRAKSAFLASTSHELRTPLNAILGFAQLMSHSPHLSSEHQEYIRIIHHSGEHLLNLINNVLDMSKIEAGSMTFKETNFNLYHLLDDLEGMFHLKALEKKLQLVFECSPDVPQYLHTDQLKLRQVLINLLNNALKFTSEGGVLVRVGIVNSQWLIANGKEQAISNEQLAIQRYAHENSNQQLAISFEVEDTGIGIAPEELESIFEPFVQAATSQQFQEGTGLGLAISRKFVQLMGGQITVSSQVGNGTIFKFDLPVKVIETTAIETQQPTRRVIALEPNQPQYRILIVDDQDYNRQLLVNLLSPLDFELREAGNGQEAVEIWENWQPHLIWMDLRMPVMDGYEATQQIRVKEMGSSGNGGDEVAGGEEETRRHGDAGTRRWGDRVDRGDREDIPIPNSLLLGGIQGGVPNSEFSILNSQFPNTIIIALTASSPQAERAVAISAGCNDFICKPFRESDIFEAMKKYLGVRYIYEKAVFEEKSLATESDNQGIASPIDLISQELAQRASILTPTTLASLPPDWLTNFQQATVEGDLDLMLTLIEQIRQQNHHLADALSSLANQFQFEELLALIEE